MKQGEQKPPGLAVPQESGLPRHGVPSQGREPCALQVPPRTGSPDRRRACAYLGAGAALGLLPRLFAREEWDVCLWIADRGADRIHGLDRSLIVRRSVTVDAPTGLAHARGGGLWVLGSLSGAASGPFVLQLLEPGTQASQVRLEFGASGHLVVGPGGAAFLIEWGGGGNGADQLWCVEPDGARRHRVLAAHGLTALAATGTGPASRIVAGGSSGELWSFGGPSLARDPLPLALGALGGAIRDLAPGPAGGTWALGGDRARLELLDEDLQLLWGVGVDPGRWRLVAVPGEERVWLLDGGLPEVERRGPGGRLELRRRDLPMAGLECGLAGGARDGVGLLLATPGALLRLDGEGRSLPGQGGFVFLTAMAPIPSARP